MTDSETRVLARTAVVLLVVSALRLGWELRRVPPALPPPRDDGPGLLAESRRLKAEGDARAKPLAPGETLDPNRATDAELDRLPGLGPAAAKAIVATRVEKGGFRTVDDLLEVPGIGPATLARIRPYLVPGPPGRAPRAPAAPTPKGPTARPGASGGPVASRGSGAPSGSGAPRGPAAPPPTLDLNVATAADLERLPGVGPALAARIVERRTARGRFGRVEDLLDVRGIGPATLGRLRGLVRVAGDRAK